VHHACQRAKVETQHGEPTFRIQCDDLMINLATLQGGGCAEPANLSGLDTDGGEADLGVNIMRSVFICPTPSKVLTDSMRCDQRMLAIVQTPARRWCCPEVRLRSPLVAQEQSTNGILPSLLNRG
jgi:hypothetical protein